MNIERYRELLLDRQDLEEELREVHIRTQRLYDRLSRIEREIDIVVDSLGGQYYHDVLR